LLDRQIGWFLVFENAPGIDTSNIKFTLFESRSTAEKMEEDVHAHYGTCTRGRTGGVLHGSGFGRNEAFGRSSKPGSIGLS
jgi:hypothetical protein